ncbi:hypothetical protein [Bacillus sp. B1-b2]|uniref:hypothetical protein n=1 Tax=Bacillus sp. B1-b2 TaxID=2653201 RepID=UPI0012621F5C|nr:hypothetical protein [Bacillus sp. B1-b2]KAB7671840.1 hypothetical protein F9279_05920 [Bacillus sp. B1-b2]
MTYIIRQAQQVDLERIQSLLTKAGLDVEGIESFIDYFLLMEDEVRDDLEGVVGIEPIENVGLLRSMVLQNAGAEEILFLLQQVIKLAKTKELKELYGMVNSQNAIQLFQLLGFKEIDSNNIPRMVGESKAVRKQIPVNNPIFLQYSLENVDK